MPGQDGISTKQTYIALSSEIRDAMDKKWMDGTARAGAGDVIYVKSSVRETLRLSGAERLEKRKESFANAAGKIQTVIDNDYRDWPVGNQSLGEFVTGRLTDMGFENRLDKTAFDVIDALIVEGMKQSARGAKDLETRNMADDHEALLAEVRAHPKAATARQMGAGWRKIIEGNHQLREAITNDLVSLGYDREAALAEAHDFLRSNSLARHGLTASTVKSAAMFVEFMGKEKAGDAARKDAANVNGLMRHVEMEVSLAKNLSMLALYTRGLAGLLDGNSHWPENAPEHALQQALTLSENAVTIANEMLARGPLSDTDRDRLHDVFRHCAKELATLPAPDARKSMVQILAAFSHEAAMSMLSPEQRADQKYITGFDDTMSDPDQELVFYLQNWKEAQQGWEMPQTLYKKSAGPYFDRVDKFSRRAFGATVAAEYDTRLREVQNRLTQFCTADEEHKGVCLESLRKATGEATAAHRSLDANLTRLDRAAGRAITEEHGQQRNKLFGQGNWLVLVSAAATRAKDRMLNGRSDNDAPRAVAEQDNKRRLNESDRNDLLRLNAIHPDALEEIASTRSEDDINEFYAKPEPADIQTANDDGGGSSLDDDDDAIVEEMEDDKKIYDQTPGGPSASPSVPLTPDKTQND